MLFNNKNKTNKVSSNPVLTPKTKPKSKPQQNLINSFKLSYLYRKMIDRFPILKFDKELL